jgi:hypothetical protein
MSGRWWFVIILALMIINLRSASALPTYYMTTWYMSDCKTALATRASARHAGDEDLLALLRAVRLADHDALRLRLGSVARESFVAHRYRSDQ